MYANRIEATGESVKDIYNVIIFQMVIGFIFCILYNPELGLRLVKVEFITWTQNKSDIDKLMEYYNILKVSLGIIEVIFLYIIMFNLKKIAENLMQVAVPFDCTSCNGKGKVTNEDDNYKAHIEECKGTGKQIAT